VQAAVAHLAEAPLPLDHREDVLDAGAHLGLLAVAGALDLIGHAIDLAHPLVGAVLGRRRLAGDQLLLSRVGAVAIDLELIAVQQIGQRVLVVHVGGRDHRAVSHAPVAVHADVQLHAEVPLLALAGLVHLRVALPIGVLGGAWPARVKVVVA
jgi:hypothetical protein